MWKEKQTNWHSKPWGVSHSFTAMKLSLLISSLTLLLGVAQAGSYGAQCSTIIIQGTNGTQGVQGIQGLQGIQGVQGAQGLQGWPGRDGVDGLNGTGLFTPGDTLLWPIIVDGSSSNLTLIAPRIINPTFEGLTITNGTNGATGPAGINGFVDHVVFGEQRPQGMPGRYYGVLNTKVYRPINKMLSAGASWFTLNEGYDRFGLAGVANGTTYHIFITATQQSNAVGGALQLRLTTVNIATGLDIADVATGITVTGAADGSTMQAVLETQFVITANTFYRIRSVSTQTSGYLGRAAPASMTSALIPEIYLSARVQNINKGGANPSFSITDPPVPQKPFTSVAALNSSPILTNGTSLPLTSHSSTLQFRSQQTGGTISQPERLYGLVGAEYFTTVCARFATEGPTVVYMWLRHNGVDVPVSTSVCSLLTPGIVVGLCTSMLVNISAGGHLEVMLMGTNSSRITSLAGVTDSKPVSPALTWTTVLPPLATFSASLYSTANQNIQTTTYKPISWQNSALSGGVTLGGDGVTLTFPLNVGYVFFALSVTIETTYTQSIALWVASTSTNGATTESSAHGGTRFETVASAPQKLTVYGVINTSIQRNLVFMIYNFFNLANTFHSNSASYPIASGATLTAIPAGPIVFTTNANPVAQNLAVVNVTQPLTWGGSIRSAGSSVNLVNGRTLSFLTTGAWHVSVHMGITTFSSQGLSNVCDMHLRKGLQGGTVSILENSGMHRTGASGLVAAYTANYVVNVVAGDSLEVWWTCEKASQMSGVGASGGAPVSPGARLILFPVSPDAPTSQVASSGPAW